MSVTPLAGGLDRKTVSGPPGEFAVAGLARGTYRVSVTAKGFAPARIESLPVNVGDHKGIPVVLEVASTSDQVTVTTSLATVSDVPVVATVVDREFAEKIPLNGRTLQALIGLTPGVVYTVTLS